MSKKGWGKTAWGSALAIVLALSLVISACTSGGNAPDNSAAEQTPSNETSNETSNEPADEPADEPAEKSKFSYYLWNETMDILKDSKQWQAIQDGANAEIELVNGGPRDSGYYQNLTLLFASQNLPDTMAIRGEDAAQFGAEGALLDLKPLIDEHAPNISAYFAANPGYLKQILTAEGKIFSLFYEAAPLPQRGWFYRKDWAATLGLQEPQTLDEFTAFLRALKTANPGGNEFFYPLTNQGYTNMARGFEKVFGIESYDDRLNVFNPGYKQYIEYLRMLNEEKLLDPEAALGSVSESALKEKLVNGDSAVFYRALFNAEDTTITGRELNPDFEFTVMPPITPVNGNNRTYFGGDQYYPHWAMAVSAKAKDPVGIVKFLDFLFSEEGLTLNHWGIEGESYEIVDGKKKYLISLATLVYEPGSGQNNWLVATPLTYDFPAPMDAEAAAGIQSEFMNNLIAKVIDYTVPAPKYVITPEDRERLNELEAVIEPKQESWVVGFVTGNTSMSEWDNFLADMKSMNYEEVLEILKASMQP